MGTRLRHFPCRESLRPRQLEHKPFFEAIDVFLIISASASADPTFSAAHAETRQGQPSANPYLAERAQRLLSQASACPRVGRAEPCDPQPILLEANLIPHADAFFRYARVSLQKTIQITRAHHVRHRFLRPIAKPRHPMGSAGMKHFRASLSESLFKHIGLLPCVHRLPP